MSQQRVSGFPEKGADLQGSPGASGEAWGTSGEVWETSGEPLVVGRFHSERTSGEVAEKLPGSSGNFRGGTSQKLGKPDSLPATRQICLRNIFHSAPNKVLSLLQLRELGGPNLLLKRHSACFQMCSAGASSGYLLGGLR